MAMILQHEAFHLMRQVFQQHTARWQQSLPELTKPQYAVLCAVAGQPGIEQVQLMGAAVSTKATLAELLMRLEKRGIIRRERDAADKRRRFIYLTESGEKLLHAALPVAQATDNEFLERLAPSERQALVAMLLKMLSATE